MPITGAFVAFVAIAAPLREPDIVASNVT